jgi:hypothetical protein
MPNTHRCESMDHGEAWIDKDDEEYRLNINHVTTEQDLEENGYLEEAGQTIDTVVLNLLYCPYCGVKLDESRDEIIPGFKFHDLSKW